MIILHRIDIGETSLTCDSDDEMRALLTLAGFKEIADQVDSLEIDDQIDVCTSDQT